MQSNLISSENDTNINNEQNEDIPIKYQFKEESKFGRRCPKGSEKCGIITTVILILFSSLTFFLASFTMTDFSPGKIFSFVEIILYLINTLALIDLSTSNPGYQETNKMTFEEFKEQSPVAKIGNSIFILKYCHTCQLVRDVRTFHCKLCGRCVSKHDHHCGFVSNCIGQNNIRKFFIFLIIIFIHSGYILACSAIVFVSFIHKNEESQNDNIARIAFLMFDTFLVAFFFIFVTVMLCQHVHLISKGVTKNEEMRQKYDASVFEKGCCDNWGDFCCPKEGMEIDLEQNNDVVT